MVGWEQLVFVFCRFVFCVLWFVVCVVCVFIFVFGKSGSVGWLGTTDSLGPPRADTGTLIVLSTSPANTANH